MEALAAGHAGGRNAVAVGLHLPGTEAGLGDEPLAHLALALDRGLVERAVAVVVQDVEVQPGVAQPGAHPDAAGHGGLGGKAG
eukprot:16434664-Heterocapsa_arctica.AAC.1